jgi:hypothetical protein
VVLLAHNSMTDYPSYFAGLFDGEGCVGIYTNKVQSKDYLTLEATVRMNNSLAIKQLVEEYPEAQFKYHAPVWHVRLVGKKAKRFLSDIEPHALVKKSQIQLALEYLDLHDQYPRVFSGRGGKGNQRPQEFYDRTKELAEEIKRQKKLTGEEV